MRIAVSSTGKDLNSNLDLRFGRAAYFIIVESETLQFDVVENRQNVNLPQGAGIQAAKIVADSQIDALITGNCGPKAFQVLRAAGIQMITGTSGKVIDVIQQYKDGTLTPSNAPSVEGHWV